jgi:hypothetical protein
MRNICDGCNQESKKNYTWSRGLCLTAWALLLLKLQPAHFGEAHFICKEEKRGEEELNIKFL